MLMKRFVLLGSIILTASLNVFSQDPIPSALLTKDDNVVLASARSTPPDAGSAANVSREPAAAAAHVFVKKVDINALPDIEFVDLAATYVKFFSPKMRVCVYYGQPVKLFEMWEQQIETNDGTPIEFNGVIDALNYMYKNGWEYVNGYTDEVNDSEVWHYILRKRK